MRTTEDVHELGLYANDCCSEELIFDKGDTFWRCPRCRHLCTWELEAKITKDPDPGALHSAAVKDLEEIRL